MNREDFDILNSGIIYFDNAATTQKPKSVVNEIVDYYTKYTANSHRGDYDISLKVDEKFDGVREKVKELINASDSKEIVFTRGATESFNMIIFGFMSKYLKNGDRVLLSKAEHASNLLPWIELSKRIGFVIDYAELESNYSISINKLKEKIYPNTKVIALAHITNTIGDVRPIKEIGEICKNKNILFVVDATQSIGHMKLDVQENNISFMGFSGHKMLGPTGVGVLYGKYELLDQLIPQEYGGGMNISFDSNSEYELKSLPIKLEAGTSNISGVLGLGAAIDYLNLVGLDNIHNHEVELKKYLVEQMSTVPNIKIYNKSCNSGVLLFNIGNFFSQDVAIYLNKFNICVRAGNHCAKMLHEEIEDTNTCRVSLYLYNTKEEIDKLVSVLKDQDKILDTVV